ncbi:MAG: ABC transporter permease [Candidatus Acidiferrales bacterium]
MPMLSRMTNLLRNIFAKEKTDRDLDEEVRSYSDLLIQEKIREGMTPEEARRTARIELGGIEQVKEEVREVRAGAWLDSLIQDLRYGARMLRRNPAFTAIAVLTLALGIGANTAIFSVVHGVLLSPLPYNQPDRLVMIMESNPRYAHVWVSYPNFRDWQRQAQSFLQMAAFMQQGYDLTNPGTPEHIDGSAVTAGFFGTLGVRLTLGRDFSPKEDQRGGAHALIISDRLWRNRFAQDPQVLGKPATLDGMDYFIVGVLPPGFRFWSDADVYTPLGQGDPLIIGARGSHDGIGAIARLRPQVSISQAKAEMGTIQNALDRLYPDDNRDLGTDVMPLKRELVGDVSGILVMLFGAVGLVLLIACANVANLFLARSAARSREFGIRAALGANRARLTRQLIAESVLLSLTGGALGVLIAIPLIKSLLAAFPDSLPRSANIAMNTPVLFFTFGVSFVVGILFGLAPALKNRNSDLQASLKDGGRASTSSRNRAQSSLVIVQVALTLVLLVSAGLLFRTIRQLAEVDPGFDTEHVITFKVGVSRSLMKTVASARIAYQQLIERIRDIPGVQAADFTDTVPLSGQGGTIPFWIDSQKPASLQAAPRLVGFLTGPDYFRTMGIPLLRGRLFTAQDTVQSPCVTVIDSTFSRMYFPNSDPLGRTITFGFVSPTGPCRIVGVARHVRHWALDDPASIAQNQMYFPLAQDPDQWVLVGYPYLTVVLRTPLDSATMMPAIKAAVYGAASDQPVYDVRTMQNIVSESMSPQRLPMILLSVFAALALLLASVGLYGVISYTVTQRTHEIGIRMALGAEKKDVFRLIVGRGLRLALTGVAFGAITALVLTRVLPSFSHLLYQVRASDPVTFAVVSSILVLVALLACYIPARRAMKLDPMISLRYE